MYSVTNFSVNEENIHFPSGSGNKFRVKLNSNAELGELEDDTNIPEIFFKFVSMESIQNLNKNDKIGICFWFISRNV